MHEKTGNIWEYLGSAVIAITTNGMVAGNGAAVFGRGCARQAAARFPDLPQRLGRLLREGGNHVHYLGDGIVSFPVEETPWENPDPRLIGRSARELRDLADRFGWRTVVVPRPGCGGGGLDWREVRPLLDRLFDDRFIVITECATP
ncbi:MAG TPA: ADP-ribose-binding protein [Geobacteraceae bacterium]